MLALTQDFNLTLNLAKLETVLIFEGRLFHWLIVLGMKLCFPSVELILLVSLIPLLTASLVFMLNVADICS